LLRYFESIGRILKHQVPLHGLLHRRFHHDMRVPDWPSGQGDTSAMHSRERPYLFVAATSMHLKMTARQS
jgi:hypothetical protein